MLSNHRNPVCFNLESDAYELEVPKSFTVTCDNIVYEVVVVEIIRENNHNNLFNCVTSAEDYDYVMQQYVRNQMHVFSSQVKVLVIYYDEQLALHATLPIKAEIREVAYEPLLDVSYRVNSRMKSFIEWQNAPLD